MSKVDKEKYPNATQKYRMELVKVKETEKPCKDCFMLEEFWSDFCEDFNNTNFIPECVAHKREDQKMVVFIKVENKN